MLCSLTYFAICDSRSMHGMSPLSHAAIELRVHGMKLNGMPLYLPAAV